MGRSPSGGHRIDWVDYAKGFCIIFVVMMHSTLGVEAAAGQEGWLHAVVAFAKPFRMPDFFLISGLFLAQVIDRDWRTYLDRKVVHFAYFYLLWTALQFAIKAPVFVNEHGALGTLWLYIESFWEPFSTLWFIYLLPIFFVMTKLAHGLRVPPLLIWLAAAALEIAPIHTGFTVIDELASRFVYFYTGYVLAPRIFDLAKAVEARPEMALAGLVWWGVLNGVLVFNGYAELPLVSLALGFAGAAAVVSVSVLLAQIHLAAPLRYCGRNSIVIYLAFFLPMAASRSLLLKTGWITDIGTISALVTCAGVLGSLAWFWAVRHTVLRFLFERPARFWIAPRAAKTAAHAGSAPTRKGFAWQGAE
ncbi:MAG: acyltransferase family protein [Hyphomicrobiales bacterium]|nr:acyltransferase family protein [Hyphomicrobiales bacterium]